MRQKVICTGTLGFIGSNFIRKAIYNKDKNYSYVGIDLCENKKFLSNIYLNKNNQFYLADVADKHTIDNIFDIERPDYVIHFAAKSHVDESLKSPKDFIHSNIAGTQSLIDCSVKYGIKKFVLVSTDEVYGQLNLDDPSWTEASVPNPRNPYSVSKYASELLLKAAGNAYGLQYNITRCCNNFGPRQQTKNLIPKIIKNIVNNTSVPIYGTGQQTRQWIYVEDHISAVVKVLEEGAANETYNVSTGWEFSNVEVFHEICKIMEKGDNLLKFVEDRPGHDFRYAVDSSKLRELGWKPTYKWKQALNHTVNWYLNNNWFLKERD